MSRVPVQNYSCHSSVEDLPEDSSPIQPQIPGTELVVVGTMVMVVVVVLQMMMMMVVVVVVMRHVHIII